MRKIFEGFSRRAAKQMTQGLFNQIQSDASTQPAIQFAVISCLTGDSIGDVVAEAGGDEQAIILNSLRRAPSFNAVSHEFTNDGADPLLSEAWEALRQASRSEHPDEGSMQPVLPSETSKEILKSARNGMQRTFASLAGEVPDLMILDSRLSSMAWNNVQELDLYLGSELNRMVGPSAESTSAIVRSDFAWRCAYWYLLTRHASRG